MVGRRIGYCLLALVAWAAFIWTESGVALFVSVLLTVLPLCTLAMLLIAKRHVQFDCNVSLACMRGSSLQIQMRVGVFPAFFVGTAEVAVKIQNTTFDKEEIKTFLFHDLNNTLEVYDYLDNNSGRVRMEVLHLRLYDFFGICSVTSHQKREFESNISPVLYENLQLSVGLGSAFATFGERVDTSRKGSDRSETFQIRDYVPGDSLNAVHWKLSGKFDDLKARDFASAGDYKMLFLVDLSRNKHGESATDEALNKVLDITISLSNFCWQKGIFHCVGWIDNGTFVCTEVCNYETFLKMANNLLSAKVTPHDVHATECVLTNPEAQRFTKYVFISSSALPEEMKLIDGEVTAISVRDNAEQYSTDNIRMIDLKPEYVESALVQGLL